MPADKQIPAEDQVPADDQVTADDQVPANDQMPAVLQLQVRIKRDYGAPSKDFPCRVCTPLQTPRLYHRHHSTKFLYNTLLERGETTVDCATCKHNHPIHMEEERLVIIVSTSTLHNTFLSPTVQSPIHFNLETICGAGVDLLRASWVSLYWDTPVPMDVIVCAGLNDIAHMDHGEFIQLVCLFKANVIQQNNKNTFVFTGLLRPPKYAWFPANGPEPPGYTNHLNKINEINSTLDIFNQFKFHAMQTTIGFQTEGTRSRPKRNSEGIMVPHIQHQLSAWREAPNITHCLHLTDVKRANMLNRIIKFIMHNRK